jgi:ribosomal protein S18 acetylase RimI-like enzyme
MPDAPIVQTMSGLPDADLPSLRALLDRCNQFEGLELPISPTDFDSPAGFKTAFAVRSDGNLIGFAAMPDDPTPEASLMVHPDNRRHGIGRALVVTVRAECEHRNVASGLLVADRASPSARAFIAALQIPFRSSEFRLELDPDAVDQSRPRNDRLTVRLATRDDRATLIRILMAAFAEPKSVVEPNVDLGLTQPTRDFYLAELDGIPIGAIRIGTWDGNGDVTAFGVLPEYQGKGLGRQILLDAVNCLLDRNVPRILIEVSVENRGALGLYESCGFHVQREYGYYRLYPPLD